MNFADKVKKLIDSAPEVTGRANVNFGPTTFTPIVVDWSQRDENNRPLKTPLAQYMKEHGLGDDDDVALGKDESFQLHLDMDITELNPSLDFHYERDVRIQDSNKSNKDPKKWLLTSWSEIVLPSFVNVLGKDWYKRTLPNGKGAAPVLFLAIEDAEQVEPVKEGKKAYGVPKLIAVYPDLETCRKARDERYPPRNDEEAMAFGPEDEESGEEEEGFPEEVLSQVKDLYNSTRKNAKQTLKMLESQPFGEYDAKELFQAALPDVELPKK